jgi:dipeptidyl aminopeptidase/acylaminoacyl peptidase
VRDLRISPDGREIAYEVRQAHEASDNYTSHIRIASVHGDGADFQLTQDDYSVMARWSPDGRRLCFGSSREGSTQLYVIARSGGEARKLTHFEHAVTVRDWSPDGAHILVVTSVDRDQKPSSVPDSRWQKRPLVVDRQRYKSDSAGFLLHEVSHLFLVPAEPGGKPRQITTGDADCIGGTFAPDGQRVAYCRARSGRRETHLSDLWVSRVDDRSARRISFDVPTAMSPSWSPDGRWIVFSGTREPGDARMRLWLYDVETERVQQLGGDELEVSSFPLQRTGAATWSADARRIALPLSREGASQAAVVEIPTGRVVACYDGGHQISVCHAQDGLIALAGCSLLEPVAVVVMDWSGASARTIAEPNAQWWNARRHPCATRRRFRMKDGAEIQGWLLLPEKDARGPMPLLVDVHGGPTSYAEFEYPYRVYWYALLSRGWAVLALNATGSSSFDPQESQALRARWGELDLPQHLQAVDQLQAEGLVDDRLAIAGKSYGGYLSAWAIGHTHRFKAAIVSAPVANLESHSGTSDSGYYVLAYDMLGELPERRRTFQRLSPIHYAEHATTPTLILQGQDDQRCPAGQSEELFSLLMRQDKAKVRMVLYPGGHHDLAEDGRPSHRRDYHRRIVSWCERHASKTEAISRSADGARASDAHPPHHDGTTRAPTRE